MIQWIRIIWNGCQRNFQMVRICYEKGSHMAMWDDPDVYAQGVIDFMKKNQ